MFSHWMCVIHYDSPSCLIYIYKSRNIMTFGHLVHVMHFSMLHKHYDFWAFSPCNAFLNAT